jgi:hypothetical protein
MSNAIISWWKKFEIYQTFIPKNYYKIVRSILAQGLSKVGGKKSKFLKLLKV